MAVFRINPIWGVATLCLISWVTCGACAAEPTSSVSAEVDPTAVEQVRQSIVELDAAEFDRRDRAGRRLEELADNPKLGPLLAVQFAQVLAAEQTSIEVRSRLESLLARLPSGSRAAQSPPPAASEIEPLLDRLNSDSSPERDAAGRRLRAMLEHIELVAPVMAGVKRRLADPRIDAPTYRALRPILDAARGVWVQSDPKNVPLAEIADAEMAAWIEVLASAPEPLDAAARIRRANAHRELIDLVVRDDTRPRVLSMLANKTVNNPDVAFALREIADFALPALAAEVWWHAPEDWEHRQHLTAQHLLVDVPQFPETSLKATHFDRIDDKTAHCVSGNTLTPGDYPVGLAIPHPLPGHEMMYHLINLPTPRRRLAYEFYLKRDEAQRLAEITRRTLDDFLARRHVLNEREALMLCQLEPHAVSRFVGPYFDAVADEMLSPPMTVHVAICHMLVRAGRHEAIAALEKTARSGRLGKPTAEHPFSVAWIAALAIARHQPWPGVDAWLFGLLDEKAGLTYPDPSGELGATAAGILLEHHSLPPSLFGLETASERDLEAVRLPGYRFS